MVSRNAFFQVVYSGLTTASTLSSYSVTAAYHAEGVSSFPQVVVRPIDVSQSTEGFYKSDFSGRTVNVIIEIHALDTKSLDDVTDLVIPIVKGLSFSSSNYLLGLDDSYSFNSVFLGSNAEKRNLHTRILVFTYSDYGS